MLLRVLPVIKKFRNAEMNLILASMEDSIRGGTFDLGIVIKVEWLGNPLLYVFVSFFGSDRAQRSIAFLSF